MRYFLAIIVIIFTYFLLSGVIMGFIFKGNVYGGAGLLTSFIMIPVAIFLWKAITRRRKNQNE
jgi:hypothetical protein